MSLLISKAVSMFYFNGEKLTVPICPVQMAPNLNPSIGIERYGLSDVMCSKNALFYTPFFLESFRPRYEVWSITAHETVPGHHTQVCLKVDFCGFILRCWWRMGFGTEW